MTGEEFLAHYGVKGMKWGVRKDQKTGRPKVYNEPKNYSSDYHKSIRDKKIYEMSDEEISILKSRIDLENSLMRSMNDARDYKFTASNLGFALSVVSKSDKVIDIQNSKTGRLAVSLGKMAVAGRTVKEESQ